MLTLIIDVVSVVVFVGFLFGYVMKVVTRSMLPEQAEITDVNQKTN